MKKIANMPQAPCIQNEIMRQLNTLTVLFDYLGWIKCRNIILAVYQHIPESEAETLEHSDDKLVVMTPAKISEG